MIATGMAAGAAASSDIEKSFPLRTGIASRQVPGSSGSEGGNEVGFCDADPAAPGLAPWQARRVLSHIARHLHQPLKIEELAAIARLSTGHFSHAFRRSFGAPPYGYILSRRMELARHLMVTTDDPLAQIALRCGMTDQAHLSRLFKQQVGQSPSRWRRMRMSG